jgi:hypothetical protein
VVVEQPPIKNAPANNIQRLSVTFFSCDDYLKQLYMVQQFNTPLALSSIENYPSNSGNQTKIGIRIWLALVLPLTRPLQVPESWPQHEVLLGSPLL